MGEYLNGIKLGTCEDLYYVRLTDLQRMKGAGDYLTPANGYRYRFPFPEEDTMQAGNYDPYNKGYPVSLSQTASPKLYALMTSADYKHMTVCHSASYHGTHNVNMIMPCPLSKEFSNTKEIRLSAGGASIAVVIEQLKWVDGEIWTVISCPYCEAKIRLDKEHAEDLCNTLTLVTTRFDHDQQKVIDYQDPYKLEIAKRIMAGYK